MTEPKITCPNEHCDLSMHIDDNMVEKIAEKAAQKAIEKLTSSVYQSVGRTVLTRFTWVVGATVVGIYIWLKKIGAV